MNNQEFESEYIKRRSNFYFQQFWAGKIAQNGLTIKKLDGSQIVVLPKDIYCIDNDSMSSNCLCGHPIRYEYWMAEYGPIGSTCIQTLTGLNGQDLRNILRGGQLAKKDKDDFVQLKERYKSLKEQLEKDPSLNEKFSQMVDAGNIPEEVQLFIDNNMPMPRTIAYQVFKAVNQINKSNTIVSKYGTQTNQLYNEYLEYCDEFKKLMRSIELPEKILAEIDKPLFKTAEEIGEKIGKLQASPKAVEFFAKLMTRMKNPQFIDALNVLVILTKHDAMDDFWKDLVNNTLVTALKFGLSEKQISMVLQTTSTGKAGLSTRFNDFIVSQMSTKEKIEKSSKPTPVVISTATPVEEDEFLDLDVDIPSDEN